MRPVHEPQPKPKVRLKQNTQPIPKPRNKPKATNPNWNLPSNQPFPSKRGASGSSCLRALPTPGGAASRAGAAQRGAAGSGAGRRGGGGEVLLGGSRPPVGRWRGWGSGYCRGVWIRGLEKGWMGYWGFSSRLEVGRGCLLVFLTEASSTVVPMEINSARTGVVAKPRGGKRPKGGGSCGLSLKLQIDTNCLSISRWKITMFVFGMFFIFSLLQINLHRSTLCKKACPDLKKFLNYDYR